MKLYNFFRSGTSHRLRIALNLKGLQTEYLPVDLRTVADFPNLVAGLVARGYSEQDIRKILGGNLMRVWREVEAAAGR